MTHINEFNKLLCQLLNTGDKIFKEWWVLVLLVVIPKSCNSLVQMFLVKSDHLSSECLVNGFSSFKQLEILVC